MDGVQRRLTDPALGESARGKKKRRGDEMSVDIVPMLFGRVGDVGGAERWGTDPTKTVPIREGKDEGAVFIRLSSSFMARGGQVCGEKGADGHDG